VAEKARYATGHRIRFSNVTTPEMLQLSESPAGALSWKIGPFAHKGECNHLDREHPGTLFDVGKPDPGGVCMVITTAGFIFGPELKIERVIDLQRNVDATNEWMGKADGCLVSQVFTPTPSVTTAVRGASGGTTPLCSGPVSSRLSSISDRPPQGRERLRPKFIHAFPGLGFMRTVERTEPLPGLTVRRTRYVGLDLSARVTQQYRRIPRSRRRPLSHNRVPVPTFTPAPDSLRNSLEANEIGGV
jgi:hypothetical protein